MSGTRAWGNIQGSRSVAVVVTHRKSAQLAVKVALLITTLVLIASMGGGFLLLPLLIPAHIWAARTSIGLGRIGWSLLPAISVGMVTWAFVYLAAGESKPTIWLVPTIAAVATGIAMVRLTSASSFRAPTSVH